MKKFKRGFTLIELLVVISIIGLLTSVVLASLKSARDKGSDATIKADLSGIRAQAALDYNTYGCYATGDCSIVNLYGPATCPGVYALDGTLFTDTKIVEQISGADTIGGGLSSCTISTGGTSYAVVVRLKSSRNVALGDPSLVYSWCVDSTGASKQESFAANAVASLQGGIDTIIATGACQ